jgi:hypothetical protein
VGAALAVLGVLFALQGLGYVGGSPMTGETTWAVIGPVLAVVGLALAVWSVRRGGPPAR